MLLSKTLEILFRGALASYLLLFALDIKTHTNRWTTHLTKNITIYSQYLPITNNPTDQIAPQWLTYYCQWLVLCSLLIISGLRTGKVIGWLAIIINLVVFWSDLELLFIGLHVVLLGVAFM